jgi:hypothetical protein
MTPLEELDRALVFFGRVARTKGPQVSASAGFRIGLPGIEAELTGFEFSDHNRE